MSTKEALQQERRNQIQMVHEDKLAKRRARRHRVGRHTNARPDAIGFLNHGSLRLDVQGRRAFLAGRGLNLTAKEVSLLEALLRHSGTWRHKRTLVRLLGDDLVSPNAIEVLVHRLRQKIKPIEIRTGRNLGYMLEATAAG
jgi:DNA-binding response OmpR family regulator